MENCSSSSKIPIPIGRPFSFTIAAEEIAIGNTFGTKFSKFGATPGNTFESPLDLLLSNQLRCTPEAQSLCEREKRANLTKLHSYSYLLILSQTAKQTIQPIRSRSLQSGCGKGTQRFLPGNERLAWHFDKPLMVIEHGKMPPSAASDPMAKQSEAVFHVLQEDLANRSKHGQPREAKTSGHYIQRDQPELVTQSIRDVIRESATLITSKPRR